MAASKIKYRHGFFLMENITLIEIYAPVKIKFFFMLSIFIDKAIKAPR